MTQEHLYHQDYGVITFCIFTMTNFKTVDRINLKIDKSDTQYDQVYQL